MVCRVMASLGPKSDDLPEFPVGLIATEKAIPREVEPDWVNEDEMRNLKRRFKGTTPQGREVMRKILTRARRKLWGSEPVASAAARDAREGCADSNCTRSN